MLVVKKPNGIPKRIALKKSCEKISTVALEIANNVPRVNTGPNAKNIAISPNPLLETKRTGLAV